MKSGEHLRIWRIALGISQEDFVEGIISESYYSKIERGKAGIKITHLLAILKKNGISLADFLSDLDEPDFLEDLQLLLPMLNRVSTKKVMDRIFALNLSKKPVLEAKSAQVAFSYLKKCYQEGFVKEAKSAIKFINSLSNDNELISLEKLKANYYQALLESNQRRCQGIGDLLKKLKYEEIVKELPKMKLKGK